MIKRFKEKIVSMMGSISGFTSVLGSWQICHNLCLVLTSLLSVVGITITGMPLLFLTEISKPIWIIAVVLLAATLLMYFKKGCISSRLVLFNSGLVIAGTPFKPFEGITVVYWITGGVLALSGILLFLKDKWRKK